MNWPTRVELRFVALWSPASEVQAVSAELNNLLGLAQLGWVDGQALYPLLEENGLAPKWIGPRGIQVKDPLAGVLLLCFEIREVAIH